MQKRINMAMLRWINGGNVVRKYLFIILFLLASCGNKTANANTLADCNQSTVQSAVTASSDGDTIILPSCSVTWTSSVTVDLSSGKALTIKGQPCTLDGNGRPTSCPTQITGTDVGWNVTLYYGKSFDLSNMTLASGIGIYLGGSSNSWRVHNIYFNAPVGSAMASGRVMRLVATGSNTAVNYGLIDHVTVYNASQIFFSHEGNSNTGGNYDWSLGNLRGTSNAVFLEDSTFVTPSWQYYGSFINDCTDGASDVIRHNILGSNQIQSHDAIINGQRGCLNVEAYNNAITVDPSNQSYFSIVRGGSQVMFNNVITNAPEITAFGLNVYRATVGNLGGNPPWEDLCGQATSDAYLNTVTAAPDYCLSGAGCVQIDGSGTNGYPCRDQLGTVGNGVQTIVPALFWNNTVNGSYVVPGLGQGSSYMPKGNASTDGAYCANSSATQPSLSDCQNYVAYSPYTYPHPLQNYHAPNVTIGGSGSTTIQTGKGSMTTY